VLLKHAHDALNINTFDEPEPDLLPLPSAGSSPEPSNPSPTPTGSDGAKEPVGSAMSQTSSSQTDSGKPTFQPTQAPARTKSQRRKFVVAGPSTARGPTVRVLLVDEDETLEIVEQFERDDGRFPIRVSHLRGYDGPRCDILSLETQAAVSEAEEAGFLDLNVVLRFIEVKGRSQRSGSIQLPENELIGAQLYRERYFLYRVFCDPAKDDHRELAILQNPFASPAISITRIATISLHEGSGAEWFEMKPQESEEGSIAADHLDRRMGLHPLP
jgi:hypothetical protein